jgi:hypothetical protein
MTAKQKRTARPLPPPGGPEPSLERRGAGIGKNRPSSERPRLVFMESGEAAREKGRKALERTKLWATKYGRAVEKRPEFSVREDGLFYSGTCDAEVLVSSRGEVSLLLRNLDILKIGHK